MKTLAIFLPLLLFGCALPYRAARTIQVTEVFSGRSDGLIQRTTFKDIEKGGGLFLLTDPKAQAISANSTNAFSSHSFMLGEGSIILDPNAPAFMRAVGEAVGSAAGAAAGKAVKTSIGLP